MRREPEKEREKEEREIRDITRERFSLDVGFLN